MEKLKILYFENLLDKAGKELNVLQSEPIPTDSTVRTAHTKALSKATENYDTAEMNYAKALAHETYGSEANVFHKEYYKHSNVRKRELKICMSPTHRDYRNTYKHPIDADF